jgi:site-specific recombinase XerD
VLRVHLKGGGEANLTLGADLVERLKDALLARNLPGGKEPLLVNAEGRKWTRTAAQQMLVRLGKRAGITRVRVTPHKLRHTYNVIADQGAGLSVTVRAALLNHTGTESLQRYDHMMAKTTAEARDAVRAAVRGYITPPGTESNRPTTAAGAGSSGG